MRIHLIYPNLNSRNAGGTQEPLGLLSVAAVLREAGHELSFSDLTFNVGNSYQLTDERGGRYRFEDVGTIVAGCGSAGSLIPPHEYHTIANTDPQKTAVTVHIYKHAMETCNLFHEDENGWCRKEFKQLELDAA